MGAAPARLHAVEAAAALAMPDSDARDLQSWIGRTRTSRDRIEPDGVAHMAATLDRRDRWPARGDILPPSWHWLFFRDAAPMRDLGPDGHPARSDFMPPRPLPRRMYAGGRLGFEHAIRIGDEIERVSRIADISMRRGRSGPLAFFTIEHRFSCGGRLCVAEEERLVFREAAKPEQARQPGQSPPSDPAFSRIVTPDPVLLFRFSALIFNCHRIHYDLAYATGVELYPGLVVHGPLLALLLLDLVRRELPGAQIRDFAFRAHRPVFDTGPFRIAGRRDDSRLTLWAEDQEGFLATQAEATIA